MQVTPWEVKGKLNYEKLMAEFGLQPLPPLPEEFRNNLLFRREKVFAQRDMIQILDAIKNQKRFVVMTGMVPNGAFHIGHLIVARQLAFYQKLGAKLYICIADLEAYNARGQGIEESRRIAQDYISGFRKAGINLAHTELYYQSARSTDAKKANAYYRLQNLFARHATFNEHKAVYGEISPGKMISALLQASDMLHPMLPEFEGNVPVLVPVGADQDPHLRLARDLASRIRIFGKLSSTYNKFMPGLAGDKMSASDPSSYISLTDNRAEIKRKVNKYAFSGGRATVEEHRRLGGKPEADVCYQWLEFLEEDDDLLKKTHDDYKKGLLLSGQLKNLIIEKLCRIFGI